MRSQKVMVEAIGLVALLGLSLLVKKFGNKKNLTKTDVNIMSNDNNAIMTVSEANFIDLTSPITSNTVVFPGDPTFQKEKICSIDNKCCFNLFKISMSNHMGTHIDFPAHVIPDGKTSSDYALSQLSGNGIIIHVPEAYAAITRNFIEKQFIKKNDIVFFKTANSTFNKQTPLQEKFVYIESEAAQALLKLQVKMVGIDYISVDNIHDENLTMHKLLLSHNILIVENLELAGVDPGRCFLSVMPLSIPEMDGLPARVSMLRR